MMRERDKTILLFILFILSTITVSSQILNPKFRRLTYSDGLSDNKVNCIYKSREGFLWIGTPLGLNRYDGFRIRSYFAQASDTTSLPDNTITSIQEDGDGKLWLETLAGICIFDPSHETTARSTSLWLQRHGMRGQVLKAHADDRHNLWLALTDGSLWYYDFASSRPTLILRHCPAQGRQISAITSMGTEAVINYDDGFIIAVDRQRRRLLWSSDFITRTRGDVTSQGYSTFIDSSHNLWVTAGDTPYLYHTTTHQWQVLPYNMVLAFNEDRSGNILMATDHDGLIRLNRQHQQVAQLLNNPLDPFSLPDNTISCLYVDDEGIVWTGTYRMGLAYYYSGQYLFDTLPVGDICSISEDHGGRLWLGTNDKGIVVYNPATKEQHTIGKEESGLGSDIVVSTLIARDGSFWAGTFQGGMARLKDGRWKVWRQGSSGLRSDNVWALKELPDGAIAIGTLGAGLQILHTDGSFTTLDTHNSKLSSDYIASLALDRFGGLVIGHSQAFSVLNLRDHKIHNYSQRTLEKSLSGAEVHLASPSVNQVYCDSRALLWLATAAGLNVCDRRSGKIYTVNLQGVHSHIDVCAVGEDNHGTMWITTSEGLKSIRLKEEDGDWSFFVNSYDETDGLQTRMFNKRSILRTHDGKILAGGIDGINVIEPQRVRMSPEPVRVIFSDLAFFDHVIGVGEKVNKHVVLTEAINDSREVTLNHDENTFTIQLAASCIGQPVHPRFLYRIKELGDKWSMTAESMPAISFTDLDYGHYTLEVRALDHNGNPQQQTETLHITIRPPFYLSLWAWLVYLLLITAVCWYGWREMNRRRREQLERINLTKEKELEEAKLVFFTNLGHELRTPLTLILAPLSSLLKEETKPEVIEKLRLMHRNGVRLLNLINEMLDVRRLMNNKEVFRPHEGDIVETVGTVCRNFSELSDKAITLAFHASATHIMMDYDSDKVEKIVTNLLSNAYKFTPVPGRIEVSVKADTPERQLTLVVSDTGRGVSDVDKQHIFEQFFQSKDNDHDGGSGVGLNLVATYVKMHSGTITVSDRAGGGAVFTISLPMTHSHVEGEAFVTAGGNSAHQTVTKKTAHALKHQKEDVSEAPHSAILLVDDNEDFLEFMAAELSEKYALSFAHNGKEALEMIREEHPDLVLTDVMMPEMDGNELCQRLKADERTRNIPVVMLTARLSEENEIESRECGADDYIKKPFNMELLQLHIDRLLRHEQINDEGKLDVKISQPKITTVDEQFANEATAYVEQHLDDTELSVETMSHDLGMSRVKLYRRMVAVTGKTPSEFIRLIRLRHAEQLLMKSQLTISEIAYRVGFSSQRYFSKCFKELYGYMPSQYKKEHE
ncbi:MAG: response regulator [Prevotella sp.]|nr:response regulator [Prevotella sp.]